MADVHAVDALMSKEGDTLLHTTWTAQSWLPESAMHTTGVLAAEMAESVLNEAPMQNDPVVRETREDVGLAIKAPLGYTRCELAPETQLAVLVNAFRLRETPVLSTSVLVSAVQQTREVMAVAQRRHQTVSDRLAACQQAYSRARRIIEREVARVGSMPKKAQLNLLLLAEEHPLMALQMDHSDVLWCCPCQRAVYSARVQGWLAKCALSTEERDALGLAKHAGCGSATTV